MVNVATLFLNSGIDTKRQGNFHQSISPYGVFKTQDQTYIALGVATDAQFERLRQALGLDLNGRFSTNKERLEKRNEINKLLDSAIEKLPENKFISLLEENSLPYSKINNMSSIFEMEQIKALDMVRTTNTENFGPIKYVRPPIRFDKIEYKEMEQAPLLGQHTNFILKSILSIKICSYFRLH